MSQEPQVLVIGAGPAGLCLSACLQKENVPFRLVDSKGTAGGAYQQIYSGITLASPTRYNGLPGFSFHLNSEYTPVPKYFEYLKNYAAHHQLSPQKAEVTQIEQKENGFLVSFSSEEKHPFPIVVVATGMYDFPFYPEIPGLPKPNASSSPEDSESPKILHLKFWKGPTPYLKENQKVLLVGGATSAIETAEECAKQGLRITLSTRRKKAYVWPQRFLGRDLHDYFAILESFPRWTMGSFCQKHETLPGTDLGFKKFQKEGLIEVKGEIQEIKGKNVLFKNGEQDIYDVIVLATGYQHQMPFLPDTVQRTSAGFPVASHGESHSWPGLFFMGVPCANTLTSEFLRGIAKDGPLLAKRIQKRLSSFSPKL